MKIRSYLGVAGLAAAVIICLGMDSGVFAQGRGGGRGNGGGGRSASMGQPNGGFGMERGNRSEERSDTRMRKNSNTERPGATPTSNDLHHFRGISKKLGLTPAQLNANFQTALKANPRLTFGQFVAANVVAHNLGARNPKITTAAILAGLAKGNSLGQTLHDLGVLKPDAKRAEKEARHAVEAAEDNDADER